VSYSGISPVQPGAEFMGRPKGSFKKQPKYRLHKPSGRGVVTIAGTDYYLPGVHDSEESWREYHRLTAETATRGSPNHGPTEFPATVTEVCAGYLKHLMERGAAGYKRKVPNGYYDCRILCALLRKFYGDTPARKFGPLAFRTVREEMKKLPCRWRPGLTWSRPQINRACAWVKQFFRWANSYEMVPASVFESLKTVPDLKPEPGLRETDPVRPAESDLVNAVIAGAHPTIAAMIELQWLTGMRSAEVAVMRGCDIKVIDDHGWEYRPHTHKSERHGKERFVPLGPRAQEIVRKFLKSNMTAYLFTPEQGQREARPRAKRKPPNRSSPKPRRKGWYGLRYCSSQYGRAVRATCERLFPVPDKIVGDAAKEAAWRKEHSFHPHQLRHSYGTRVRAEYGLEAAKEMLGHSQTRTTLIYAEPDLRGMKKVAKEMG
jgi:integrase